MILYAPEAVLAAAGAASGALHLWVKPTEVHKNRTPTSSAFSAGRMRQILHVRNVSWSPCDIVSISGHIENSVEVTDCFGVVKDPANLCNVFEPFNSLELTPLPKQTAIIDPSRQTCLATGFHQYV